MFHDSLSLEDHPTGPMGRSGTPLQAFEGLGHPTHHSTSGLADFSQVLGQWTSLGVTTRGTEKVPPLEKGVRFLSGPQRPLWGIPPPVFRGSLMRSLIRFFLCPILCGWPSLIRPAPGGLAFATVLATRFLRRSNDVAEWS